MRIVRRFEPVEDAPDAAIGGGEHQVAPRLGFETGGIRKGACVRIKPVALFAPGRGVNECNGHGWRLSADEKLRMHRGSAHKWPVGRSPVNHRGRGEGAVVNTS